MSIQNFLKSRRWMSSRRRPAGPRTLISRLRVEPLEERRLLAFNPAVDYPVGVNPVHVVTADFNSDGRLDLATDNANLSVMLGNADGTFQAAQMTEPGVGSLAVGDFNDDGKLDLATADSVRLGNGDGTFQAPTSIGIDINSNPHSVAVGDFNADGKLDLGVTSSVYNPGHQGYYGWYPGYYVGRANVLLGTGSGSFSAPHTTSLGNGDMSQTPPVVTDFNGDGHLDFATAGYGYAIVLLGTGTGTLGAPNYFSSVYAATSVSAGDVNGDGDLDLVTANQGYNSVGVLLGTGDGSFAAVQFYTAGGGPFSVALGDFNGDGKVDLLTTNSVDGAVGVLLGTGDGTFDAHVSIAAGAWPTGIAIGDFNHDGRLDAATANHHSSSVSVLLNNGNWPALDAPSIMINDVSVTEGNSGTTAATFTVRLSAAYGQTVTVHYATADGSATAAGGDYQAASGDVTFAPGVTSRTVTVLVNGDRFAESSESFFVRLTNPTNAIVADASGTGTILDDEPRISINPVTVTEGNTGTTSAAFTVTLSAASDQAVTVAYKTAEGSAIAGSDYVAASATLTFSPGQTVRTVNIAIKGDTRDEYDEHFYLNLSAASGAEIATSSSMGTIVDNDPPPSLRVSDATVTEGNNGTKLMVFTVTLSAASDKAVWVDYSTSDGTAKISDNDYVATSGTLYFAPGVTTMSISVVIKGDKKKEMNESFNLNLFNACDAVFADAKGLGNILNDE